MLRLSDREHGYRRPDPAVKKRILLIEQDTLTALWEEDLLTEAGYEVASAIGTLDRVRSLVVDARADAAVLKAHLYGEPTT